MTITMVATLARVMRTAIARASSFAPMPGILRSSGRRRSSNWFSEGLRKYAIAKALRNGVRPGRIDTKR